MPRSLESKGSHNGSPNKLLRVTARGNKTPMQLLTGMVPEGAVAHIAWLGVDAKVAATVTSAQIADNMKELHDALEGLWADAVEAQHRRRRGRKPRRLRLPEFQVGDTVLVAQTVPTSKLAMTWTGPHEVVRPVNRFVYKVRPCVPEQGKRRPQTVHVVRMRRFANAALGSPADARAIEKAALVDFPDNIPQRLCEHRMTDRGMEVRVRWLGFDETHDSWEALSRLAEDVPELVEQFLYKHRADARCARALRRYFPGGS